MLSKKHAVSLRQVGDMESIQKMGGETTMRTSNY